MEDIIDHSEEKPPGKTTAQKINLVLVVLNFVLIGTMAQAFYSGPGDAFGESFVPEHGKMFLGMDQLVAAGVFLIFGIAAKILLFYLKHQNLGLVANILGYLGYFLIWFW